MAEQGHVGLSASYDTAGTMTATTTLEARFVGDEVRDGFVRYSGPNRCHGSGEWTARLGERA